MLYKDVLSSRSATLHTIKNYHIRSSFNSKRCIIIRSCATNFYVNRFFPTRNFSYFKNFDF